jgi:hypothetical protein
MESWIMACVNRSNLKTVKNYLFCSLVALLIFACGDGTGKSEIDPNTTSPGTGAVTFSVQWPVIADKRLLQASPSSDVCVDYGIATMIIDVYDAAVTVVKSQSRNCSEHQATISNIPAGSGMWLTLKGMVNGTSQWMGQSEIFIVSTNDTTDAGTVSMHYIGDDTVRPEVNMTTPADGTTNVSLNTKIVAIFTEEMVFASVIPAFTLRTNSTVVAGAVTYTAGSQTATFTPDGDLPPSTQFTATVRSSAEDLAGNQMAGDRTWQFTSTSIDAPSTTTLEATNVTESAATLNGEINPNGLSTTYYFAYGTDDNYGQSTTTMDAGTGADPVAVSADITGLGTNTDYHFRIVATNASGTSNGADNAFKTAAVWAKTYGSTNSDAAGGNLIQPTLDNGYIAVTSTNSFGAGDYDIWVLKLDASGNVIWEKTYGGPEQDLSVCVVQTAAGGYAVTGHTSSFGAGDTDLWVLYLEPDGSTVWSRTYGGAGSDKARFLTHTSDGGFIIAGTTQSFGAGEEDVWILKLNPSGFIAWQKTYGGAKRDYAPSIRQTLDGGFIVGASTESFDLTSTAMWIFKLNADGTIAWQNSYGGSENDYFHSVFQTLDGGYLVAGYTGSFGAGPSADIWIMKLDANGTVQWQSTYGGQDGDLVNSIGMTMDGGYIIAGDTQNFRVDQDDDIWAFKLNADGTIAWEKTYGGPGYEHAGSIRQTSDGGYVLIGSTSSFGAGGGIWGDLWVLKLGHDGILGCNIGIDSSALIYTPNVAGSTTNAVVMDTSVSDTYGSHIGINSTASITIQCP